MAEFGLAASILQVIDFSTKFALTAYDIYTSSAKAANGLEGLQAQSKDLEVVLSKLQTESEQFAAPSHDGENDGIVVLAEKSAASLKKMLKTLSKIKRPAKGRFREAVKATFKLHWKEGEIAALQTELNNFRHQITLNLVFSVR